MGQHITRSSSLWEQLCSFIGISGAMPEFMTFLKSTFGENTSRIFLMIDAINEGDGIEVWPQALDPFLSELSKIPNLAVVLSCRSSYELSLLETSKIKRQFLKVTHHGFTGNLVKATLRYFQHYGIKIHEIPLINEFSNPLFLKIYCRSLLDYNTKSPMVGHRGMRSTIEKFYWAVDRDIGKTLGYGKTKKPTWDAAKELASAMARNGCDWLERATAQQIVENIKERAKCF